ncbi:hypothetical protein ACSDR0_46375 [Streptosporangium sp. G11]|uniref:hypothetical protein n=1 Tax=Streptosporangium sp. G11 TaxID=3436926 RepID=UPI003EBEF8FF
MRGAPWAAWSQGGEGADAVGDDAPGDLGGEGDVLELVRDAGMEVELNRDAGLAEAQGVGRR